MRGHPGSPESQHLNPAHAVQAVALEPADVPMDDVVAAAKGGQRGAEEALQHLVCEMRVRVAATVARGEALAAAATQTSLEWSVGKSQVLVRLYGAGAGVGGGVAAMDVPLEWPLHGAQVRVVGLMGLAPGVVASTAQRVAPGGYPSVAAALRATRNALAAAGHFPAAA